MRANQILFSLIRPTILCLILASNSVVFGQSSSFTYQGRLNDGGTPASGNYDLEFRLFDVQSGGTALATQQQLNVAVSSGVFTVVLDFGANFNGGSRWLEIGVRPAGGSTFTTLAPRQPITSTPYAIRSLNATTADTATNATQLGGVAANNYVQTNDSRLSDSRPPTPGSSNYIQNTLTQQAASNFNVSGNGSIAGRLSVGISNPGYRFNVTDNTDLPSARFVNTGSGPALSGQGSTTTGITSGIIGANEAGVLGIGNTGVLGRTFGTGNPIASIGVLGDSQSATGITTGVWGQSRSSNGAGVRGWATSTTGSTVGVEGRTQSPNGIGVIGTGTETATGVVGTSETGLGVRGQSGNASNFFGSLSAGVWGDSSSMPGVRGTSNSDVGVLGRSEVTAGVFGSSFSGPGVTGSSSSGIGGIFNGNQVAVSAEVKGGQVVYLAGGDVTGSEIKFRRDGVAHYSIYNNGNLTFANTSDTFLPNTPGAPLLSITSAGTVGIGTTSPGFRLHVNGETRTNTLSIDNYVNGTSGFSLCANTASNRVGLCPASSIRYKTNITNLTLSLATVLRLRPVTFDWKDSGDADLGLIAEEVAQVDPQLALFRDGKIEGVKYDRIGVVLINAVKEQQAQIQKQQAQLEEQQKQIAALKNLLCRLHPRAQVCRQIHP